jgi:hypothetical protein
MEKIKKMNLDINSTFQELYLDNFASEWWACASYIPT